MLLAGFHARHGRQIELIKALHCSSCPYTIFLISNLLIDAGGIEFSYAWSFGRFFLKVGGKKNSGLNNWILGCSGNL